MIARSYTDTKFIKIVPKVYTPKKPYNSGISVFFSTGLLVDFFHKKIITDVKD